MSALERKPGIIDMEPSMTDKLELEHQLSDGLGNEVGSEALAACCERHNVRSAPFLTVADDETASLLARHLAPRITGKTIVEIGGGIGLLSLHMAQVAKRVYCIEANPVWSFAFTELLLERKPKNLSFLFGAADEFIGCIKADVTVVCTHSDVQGMTLVGRQFSPNVIEVYGELVEANPAAFDAFARQARRST